GVVLRAVASLATAALSRRGPGPDGVRGLHAAEGRSIRQLPAELERRQEPDWRDFVAGRRGLASPRGTRTRMCCRHVWSGYVGRVLPARNALARRAGAVPGCPRGWCAGGGPALAGD